MKARILHLEDNALDAELVAVALAEADLASEVQLVGTGSAFRQALLSHDFDVILADNRLPDFDGLSALRVAQELTPATPFLFVSGTIDEGFAIDALRHGASDYIYKTRLEKLAPTVKRAVREKYNFDRRMSTEHELQRISEAMHQNQKMVVIGRMAGTIAHEINNPLEAVANFLYLLRGKILDEEGMAYLSAADAEMTRAMEIARQTLHFYREAPTPVAVQFSTLADQVLRLFSRKMEMKQISTKVELLPCHELLAMPGELRQIVANLVSNAIDATARGGSIRLRVKETCTWGKNRQRGVQLIVGDNGSGIARSSRRRVGEAFFTTKGQDGTGLGMWVTRGILRKYNGQLHVYSSTTPSRHGTVMSIFIPYLPLGEHECEPIEPKSLGAAEG